MNVFDCCLSFLHSFIHSGKMYWVSSLCFVVVIHLLSPVRLFVTPWIAARQAPLSFTIAWSLLKFMSIELVMLSYHLILCCPLLLLLSVFPSIRVFSNKLTLPIRWPKYWNLASVLPVNIQSWFPLGLTGWSYCCPRESQEIFPAPQFKSMNSLVFSLLYGSTFTSVHDY